LGVVIGDAIWEVLVARAALMALMVCIGRCDGHGARWEKELCVALVLS